jgi:hypothetical protein
MDSTAGQSGEELLRQFLTSSTVIEVSAKSSERSSPMSSDGGTVVDTDMTVKETVSDPTRGIRLTILKRPKLRVDPEPPVAKTDLLVLSDKPPLCLPTAEPSTSFKVKELAKQSEVGAVPGTKIPSKSSTSGVARKKLMLAEVFDEFMAKKRPNSDVVFVFRFQGRTQQCIAPATLRLLPRWGIGGRSTISWYQVLCRRLPHIGPCRRQKAAMSDSCSGASIHLARAGACALDLAQTML